MDKQPFYGMLAKNDAGKRPGVMLVCGITEPCPAFANPDHRCTGCTEYALVNPQELATLESQLATANEACAAKDEALKALLEISVIPPKDERVAARARQNARAALSGDTTQTEEEARVGRAVEEWLTTTLRQVAKDGFAPHTSRAAVIVTLRTIIAQAKAGEPRA